MDRESHGEAPVVRRRHPALLALPDDAPRVDRPSAKAVLVRAGRLLLVRSRHGDVEFPGGGLDPGEDPRDAVVRELGEECGLDAVVVGAHVLTVVDERPAREPGAVFRQVVAYYRATSDADPDGPRRLEDYEAELGLHPVWLTPAEALAANAGAMARLGPEFVETHLWWTPRESVVLERLLADGVL